MTECLILEALAEHESTSAAELARICFLTPQALTAPLRRLVDLGYVERAADLSYGRVRVTRLTPAGSALVGNIHAAVDALQVSALEAMSVADQRSLLTGLRAFAEGFERVAAGEAPNLARV